MSEIQSFVGGRKAQEMILAAAGSGKTYRLSSRMIALVADGASSGDILASTFTRKAAGEITSRVLVRLARAASDPEQARALERSMPAEMGTEDLTTEACADMLSKLVGELHRLQVLTLDAFFFRVARTFALELGLPQSWRLAQDPDRDRIRSRAIEATLRELDPGFSRDLVRAAGYGVADRGVHRMLLDAVQRLHEVFRALDPDVSQPWGSGARPGVDLAAAPDLIARLEEASLPTTKSGRTDERWVRARAEGVESLREERWDRFLGAGLPKALLHRDGVFGNREMSMEIRAALDPLIRLARDALLVQLDRRLAALGRFLPEYDRRAWRIRRAEGLYHFDDLTHVISRLSDRHRPSELFYRLDHRIRHLLLDEFQDTSNAQWAALSPLTDGILTTRDPHRALFIVADPKQSIYGWRGGEPRLLDDIRDRLELTVESVSESWRSSAVVLRAVNRVFGRIEENEVLVRERDAARAWARSFEEHHPAPTLQRPGYVHLEVGPEDRSDGPRSFRPGLLRHAADQVAQLHRQAPGARIGILTRTNRNAAYVFAELRARGLEASEEGGVPVADAAPVVALLSLLTLVDHPADRVAAYLVRKTPVSALLDSDPGLWDDPIAQDRALRKIRIRLLGEGYGRVISEWVGRLVGQVSARDGRRLRQLAELAFRWDERATSRPSDFVRIAEAARAEDPATAPVRVMTIHGAKGLEFDAVILPDLDALSISGDRNAPYMAFRENGTGPVRRVLPRVHEDLLPLFPELEPAAAQEKEGEVRDALSVLYVGMTRAKYAIYVYVDPDPKGSSSARTGARVLRAALAPDRLAVAGAVLYRDGGPQWWREENAEPRLVSTPLSPGPPGPGAESAFRLAPSPRRRMVPHRAPSELGDAHASSLSRLLRPEPRMARTRGAVLHHWLAEIDWIEDGLPSDSELLRTAAERVPHATGLPELLEEFHGWLGAPDIRRLLSREAFPEAVEVRREFPFIVREDGGMIEGRADRVLYVPDAGVPRILIVEWKSERLDPADTAAVDRVVDSYRPQVEAYIRGFAKTEKVPIDRVEGLLAFVASGFVRKVSATA